MAIELGGTMTGIVCHGDTQQLDYGMIVSFFLFLFLFSLRLVNHLFFLFLLAKGS